MEPEEYRLFTEDLRLRLESNPDVLALVAVGSMAERGPAPDRWSDHDFFVVTAPGRQESFRTDLSWLPRSDRIALAFRETAHGLKVVFRDGHLLEFAVFDPDELALARVNRYRVLFDREHVGARFATVAAATATSPEAAVPSDEWLAGQFLTNLLVGVGRHERGERLSGRHLVKGAALRHLVVLCEKNAGGSAREAVDSLDPFRRFEKAFPSLSERMNEILEQDTPAAARALLDLAVEELPLALPPEAVEVIRARLAF